MKRILVFDILRFLDEAPRFKGPSAFYLSSLEDQYKVFRKNGHGLPPLFRTFLQRILTINLEQSFLCFWPSFEKEPQVEDVQGKSSRLHYPNIALVPDIPREVASQWLGASDLRVVLRGEFVYSSASPDFAAFRVQGVEALTLPEKPANCLSFSCIPVIQSERSLQSMLSDLKGRNLLTPNFLHDLTNFTPPLFR